MVPTNSYERIAPQSDLSLKHVLDIGAGEIDVDYRGLVSVLLINNGPCDYKVRKGDRIAQLICESIAKPIVIKASELEETHGKKWVWFHQETRGCGCRRTAKCSYDAHKSIA